MGKRKIMSGICCNGIITGTAAAAPGHTKSRMKTPIAYYGGKLNMVKRILPRIPEHKIYVEPFFGGGAVFFAKEPSKIEVINDKFDLAIGFFQTAKRNFPALKKRIEETLHAEQCKNLAQKVLTDSNLDDVSSAWAFWVLTNMTFAHKFNGGFAFGKDSIADTTAARIDAFTNDISQRLRHVQIFCRDALDVIRRFDSEETFFYLDPPYVNSDCGHYNKGKDIYYDLLNLLPELRGKWLLSSYPTPELDRLRNQPGICGENIVKSLAVSAKNTGKVKTETLTWNYELSM